MSAEAPKVRTHSVREVVLAEPSRKLEETRLRCRGCNRSWLLNVDREWLERQPCGTPEARP